jgi:hypothetical protein
MKPQSSLAVRAIAVCGLAAAIITGCTTTTTVHISGPKPRPTPTVTSAAELILLATARECARFTTTYGAMRAITLDSNANLDALTAVIAKRGDSWQKAISFAAHVADEPGIPTGNNPARTLAAELARDAVDISNLRGDIALGRSGKIQHAWNQTFTDLASTQQLC